MLAKALVIIGLVSAGLLLIVLTSTTPATAGAFGMLAVFLLSYIAILCAMTFIVWFVARVIERLGKDFRILKKANPLTLKKAYYYSTVIALGPIIFISLQTVGTVSIYELALIILFIILGYIYVSRRTE
ncbi:MAG: rane protein of unknown function [Candidatus Saccharibacteria bacterium]|nr:rane protein of unknown function [Candidatus Saccharibacteria bacterium]